MPELPEVETIKNDLVRVGLCGKTIQDVDIFWHRTLATPSVAMLKKQIVGASIKALSRRGKYLIFELIQRGSLSVACGTFFLIIHLRMSGKIDIKGADFLPRKHDRARILFQDGQQLLFNDTRKFGRWYFVEKPETILGKLGIEPLDKKFTENFLREKLKNKNRILKPLLLDQTFIAGIGNIYADEALWYAKLHPSTLSSKLETAEIKRLHNGIVKAISLGVQNAGTSMGVGKANFYSVGGKRGGNQDKLKVFRRTGEKCMRCSDKIIRIIVGQRSTHLCPTCQKRLPFGRQGGTHGRAL